MKLPEIDKINSVFTENAFQLQCHGQVIFALFLVGFFFDNVK